MRSLTECHLCKQKLVRADFERHVFRSHGCVKKCLLATGKGNYHRFDCKEYVWESCYLCGCKNPPHDHLKIEHGCQKCVIVQKEDRVYVEHRDHKGKTGKDCIAELEEED